jgi:hypothetical protein
VGIGSFKLSSENMIYLFVIMGVLVTGIVVGVYWRQKKKFEEKLDLQKTISKKIK